MELKLQNIVFPNAEELMDYQDLFYKAGQSVYDKEEGYLAFARYSSCNFATYLNAFSYKKWKKYTKVEKVYLKLKIEGKFKLVVSGYHRLEQSFKRVTLLCKEYDLSESQEIQIEIPKNKETLVGFELQMFTECKVHGGGYYGEVAENELNEVCLSIATTTYKKEEYIRRNVQTIKDELLDIDDMVSENLYLHIVDNDEGRSLRREEFEGGHVYYHPNKNVGGSGGFTRGMIESIRQQPKATHVLLMDDDIMVLPESIRKTYMLLLLLKEKYKGYIISGAMLRYEQMDVFHEDVGFIGADGGQNPSKKDFSKAFDQIVDMADMLQKEEAKTKKADSYAGWWFCCIPVAMIEENGYALPLFVRGDDTEFSLRNHAQFITMNGICVWHMGFTLKFSYFMEYYQVFRNLLIAEACNPGSKRRARIWKRFKGLFLSEILRFNYNACDTILDAVRDYLKGPAFIEQEKCQERLKKMSKKNAVMRDLSEFEDYGLDVDSVYKEDVRIFKDTLLYRLTFNGQILWPRRLLRKGPAVVAHDWFCNPQRQCLMDSVIAVNPYEGTAQIRKLDKKRFWKVVRKYAKVMGMYRKLHRQVDQEYYDKRKYLTSYEFWAKYLELEKYQ